MGKRKEELRQLLVWAIEHLPAAPHPTAKVVSIEARLKQIEDYRAKLQEIREVTTDGY